MGRSAVLTKAKSAAKTKAKDVGDQVGPKARELRDAIGPAAKELRDAAGPKVKEVRRSVGYWIAGEEPDPPKTSKWPAVIGTGVGALAVFLFDPVSGRRRRAAIKEWAAMKARSLTGRVRAMEGRAAQFDEKTFDPTA